MRLHSLDVKGLFGHLNHHVPFPESAKEDRVPSLVILFGRNGVGKTTLLRMLAGLMSLDFDVFREVPFSSCQLSFSNGDSILVEPVTRDSSRPLRVVFQEDEVLLHPERKGAFDPANQDSVEEFRTRLFKATESVTLDFIETSRSPAWPHGDTTAGQFFQVAGHIVPAAQPSRTVQREPPESDRAARTRRFIREAQVDFRRFFGPTEPDLFARIMTRLRETSNTPSYKVPALLQVLKRIQSSDRVHKRLGLQPDQWNYKQLVGYAETLAKSRRVGRDVALTVLGAYTEVLESRCNERQLIADRLLIFEDVMRDFLLGKRVLVDATKGLRIETDQDEELNETQLSSGEYHLLHLMVAALTTKRSGTVIAIDEPEMSMHIEWQRKLIRKLLEVASNAAPQFVLATHSPDVAADYPDYLVELKFDARHADSAHS